MLLTDDQVFFWTDAQRMLFGERPYVDFFQFTAPGTDLVYFLALKLAGGGVVATNLVDVALGLALSSVCFRVAAAMMSTNSCVARDTALRGGDLLAGAQRNPSPLQRPLRDGGGRRRWPRR
jgi:hypothetical protein